MKMKKTHLRRVLIRWQSVLTHNSTADRQTHKVPL